MPRSLPQSGTHRAWKALPRVATLLSQCHWFSRRFGRSGPGLSCWRCLPLFGAPLLLFGVRLHAADYVLGAGVEADAEGGLHARR